MVRVAYWLLGGRILSAHTSVRWKRNEGGGPSPGKHYGQREMSVIDRAISDRGL
jgi:hypothetical protein